MVDREVLPESDPRRHIIKLKGMLREAAQHARDDVRKVEDPKAQALFETTAEVLDGLHRSFDHFEERSEPGWQ